MKARAFALMLFAVLLCAVVLTVSGTDNCCFVDRQCTTEQEWINGWHAYQNNQCGAPSPAPASSQPTGGAPAQIDNCCFVDRQCSTDLDWISGGHAYRAGQCGAPAQSPAPASSQPPAGPAPANIDICCPVDRQCSTDLDWIGGWHAYRAGQCGATGQAQTVASSQPGGEVILRTATGIVIGHANGHARLPSTSYTITPALGQIVSYDNCCQLNWQCDSDQDWAEGDRAFQNNFQCGLPGLISIVGDPDFIDFFVQRLEELRTRLPHQYNYVLSGMDKIQQARSDLLGGHVDTAGRIFFVPWSGPTTAGWDTRMSAVLVHEACHIHRYYAGHDMPSICGDREGWIREEVLCREMELQVVIALDAPAHVIEWVRGMVAETRTGENYNENCE